MTRDREEEIRMLAVNLDESRPFSDTGDAPPIRLRVGSGDRKFRRNPGSGVQRRVVNLYIGDWN